MHIVSINGNDGSGIVCDYVKGGAKPKPEIKYRGMLLTEGVDYTLRYNNMKPALATDAKAPTVSVIFKGRFVNDRKEGKVEFKYTISQGDIGKASATAADKVCSTKKNAWKSAVVVKDVDGKALSLNVDYNAPEYFEDSACTMPITDEVVSANTTVYIKIILKKVLQVLLFVEKAITVVQEK